MLQVLHDILSSGSKSALLKAKLTSRALKAEEDFANGRVYTTDQIRDSLAARTERR